MRNLKFFFVLSLMSMATFCYCQNDKPKTLTIKIPNVKVVPSVCLGYVDPHSETWGTFGLGINSQCNLEIGKSFYFGLNYGFQMTGMPDNFKFDFSSKLNSFGVGLGVKVPIKNELSLTIGGIASKGLFSSHYFNKTWGNIFMLDLAIKYKLSNRLNFLNRIQFGGGNVKYEYTNWNLMTNTMNYRTLNFMFGVEFN
jgi:hypothetical protein